MNSLVRVFSNFKDFYSEINGATLTGAIDVIVVEQPDGEFLCSPFHVRFGKLGVLRSREKIVDIEVNGEPVDIHMKLGESGEAFFVEECPEEEIEELPENLATSPLPSNDFTSLDDVKTLSTTSDIPLSMPIPRRNSIDLSKECNEDKKDHLELENQVSDYKTRRYTDNHLERRDLQGKIKEFTTQKLRQEWAEHEDHLFPTECGVEPIKDAEINIVISPSTEEKPLDIKTNDNDKNKLENNQINDAKDEKPTVDSNNKTNKNEQNINIDNNNKEQQSAIKDDSKSKKKRRKKSQMKKKNSQRKESISSSFENTPNSLISGISQNTPLSSSSSSSNTIQPPEMADIEPDSISNNGGSSNDESSSKNESSDLKTASTATTDNILSIEESNILIPPNRCLRELDIHFFSDTEVGNSGNFSPRESRPSSPIQSDTEFEISQQREKDAENAMTSSTASWKWGELPETQLNEQKDIEPQAQRNSMLSGMFSFMKKTNKIRKCSTDGGVYLSEIDAKSMDPEMAALYFPSINKDLNANDDDQESGNGTSLPHSPSSMEGGPKSLDSDYDEGKPLSLDNKYIDFVAISDCGGMEKGGPTEEEFNSNIIKFSDVCENPSLFSSPNLVVRLNGKYFSWAAACPIIMTIITFKKALPNSVIEQLMNVQKNNIDEKLDQAMSPNQQQETKRGGYSWWYWRRSGANGGANASTTTEVGGIAINESDKSLNEMKSDPDLNAVGTQTSRAGSPDENKSTNIISSTTENSDLLKTHNTSIDSTKGERYRKSLRLTSEVIKQLNLKEGMNEVEFSVTTAYQGTSRCKCYLFRWKHSDRVVISDIDGTITKSDVLGHILPMVGRDWAQIGVAQLFSKIEENGYKLLYLSARAIGQSRVTREYLRSIRQGDVQLPDGPLLLNPTSLISALHREVIERKPEQFKIACLSDIQALFPNKNPFYAGYGNRINDVWAYRAVGIPIMRIFTINTKGELKHELTQTFQSSYTGQTLVVNEIFPPIIDSDDEADDDSYYRDDEDELQFHQSETENEDDVYACNS